MLLVLPTHAQNVDLSSFSVEFRPCIEQSRRIGFNPNVSAESIVTSCRAFLKELSPFDDPVQHEGLIEVYALSIVAEERAGNHAIAQSLYKRAIVMAEKAKDPTHLITARLLYAMAELLSDQKLYIKAEPLYLRALAIQKKALGPEHPIVAESLFSLGALYYLQLKYAKAEPLYLRALEIKEKALGRDNLGITQILKGLGALYEDQSQFAKAEQLYLRAMAIEEKTLAPDHPDFGNTLSRLGLLYLLQDRYVKAESMYLRALEIREKSLGPDHPDVADSLSKLGSLYRVQGRYAKAEPLFSRALDVNEKAYGAGHPDTAEDLRTLGEFYVRQGQYAKAESFYVRALSIEEKSFGPDHTDVAATLDSLGSLYREWGQYTKTESMSLRALAIKDKVLGPDHRNVSRSLESLGSLYKDLGQCAKAEPLLRRALAISEKTFGPDHSNVAQNLNSLAICLVDLNRFAEAESLHLRALAIAEKKFGPNHEAVAIALNNLAVLYLSQDQPKKAMQQLERARAITENLTDQGPQVTAGLASNLAILYRDQGRYAEAGSLFQRALILDESAYGPDHPKVANTLAMYATTKALAGDPTGALTFLRRANAIYRLRIINGDPDSNERLPSGSLKVDFDWHLALLAKQGGDASLAESFDLAQLRGSSATGRAVGQMAARFAKGNNAMAKSVRQRQDLALQLKATDDNLVKELGKATGARNGILIDNLRAQSAAIKQELTALDTDITKRFPEYVELTRPEPLSVSETQKLLKDDDALLVYVLAEKQSWVWVVRKNAASWRTLDTNKAEVEKLVASVRGRMNDSCGDLPCPAELGALHALYTKLVAPIADELKDVRHLLLVPDGGLQGLPFSMLVASPAQHATDPLKTDYTKVDWLAQHYSVTVLPAVQSLRALRLFARSEFGQEPFIGFGDPALDGSESHPTARGKRIEHKVALRGGLADTAEIRQLEPLPATATELKAIAKTLKANPDTLWLRERAAEDNVKTLDLSRYRTVAFATHGQLAGSVKGSYEPGLIFTPPAKGSEQNDGYLTASEAAQLKLRAEWVLLSACNTAAPDGTPGAEGLSGLAKAFFYAGGKTLLVSHWPVDSDATVKLTTTMMRLHQDDQKMNKAEAHRQSMLMLMNDRHNPEYAHPFYWAPFAIVGEGGR